MKPVWKEEKKSYFMSYHLIYVFFCTEIDVFLLVVQNLLLQGIIHKQSFLVKSK